ncbi:MAG: hypothetical protein WD557_05540 [Dehalococcoidia bacterium]
MRVLRLSNSYDFAGDLRPEERSWFVAGEVLAQAAGEPVETTVRNIWPTEALPGLVDRWLVAGEPDLVFMKINWYWYAYESVPLRIRRKLGLFGRPLASAGENAAKIGWLSRTWAFQRSRRLVHRLMGGDSFFSEADVVERTKLVIRRIVTNEDRVVVVRATGAGRDDTGTLADYFERYQARTNRVEREIAAFCAELGVHFSSPDLHAREDQDLGGGDGLHKGARGYRVVGEDEGAAMVAAWRASHAGTSATSAKV